MMTGPPTQAALLVSACIALCESQPEKSEATSDDEADPAHPHRYRPASDHDWPVHINPHQVEQRTAAKITPATIENVFWSMSDHPKFLRSRLKGAVALTEIIKPGHSQLKPECGARGHQAGGFFRPRIMREFCLIPRARLSSGSSRTSHSRLIVTRSG